MHSSGGERGGEKGVGIIVGRELPVLVRRRITVISNRLVEALLSLQQLALIDDKGIGGRNG